MVLGEQVPGEQVPVDQMSREQVLGEQMLALHLCGGVGGHHKGAGMPEVGWGGSGD